MAISAPPRERVQEQQEVWIFDHALTFEEYLEQYEGVKEHVELIRGVPTTRMAANIPHEKLFNWFYVLITMFVESRDLGIIFGSRTAVKITNYDGRLPDILFIRKERLHILEYLCLSEPPDLVIELISPGDRLSDRLKLEADYLSIGVPEIVFVDANRRRVKTFRLAGSEYQIDELKSGKLRLETVPGFWIDIDWLFDETRPPVHEILSELESSP